MRCKAARYHVRHHRHAGAHLGRFLDLVERVHVPTGVDCPENQEDEQRKDHRELGSGSTAAVSRETLEKVPDHKPITAASDSACICRPTELKPITEKSEL